MKIAYPFLIGLALAVGSSCDDAGDENRGADIPLKEHSVLSVLWQQQASEKKALQFQAYNIAKHRIEEYLKSHGSSDNLAVITDIDETALDNSPFNAKLILDDKDYTSTIWKDWSDRAEADTIAGALDFFNFLYDAGIEIFYVTNRNFDEQNTTLVNLKKFGFPNADKAHIYTKGDTVRIPGDKSSNKETRRKFISKNHEIIMLLGDNLDDFLQIFYDQETIPRNRITSLFAAEFGRKFIVFPNAMYGTWETVGIYHSDFGLNKKQKYSARIKKLKSYQKKHNY